MSYDSIYATIYQMIVAQSVYRHRLKKEDKNAKRRINKWRKHKLRKSLKRLRKSRRR